MPSIPSIDERLRFLQERRRQLPDRLRQEADRLRRQGTAPPTELLEEVRRYAQWFLTCEEELSAGGDVESCRSGLDHLIQRHERLQALAPTMTMLSQMAVLAASSDGAQSAIIEVREEARRLLDSLKANPDDPVAATLADGTHPLSHLRNLSDGAEILKDADWETAFDVVAERYGRSLAVAAVRRRLTWADPLACPQSEDGLSDVNASNRENET